ncbi:MAG: transposase DNA-binding-containing protein, partial [Burkholderiaceae bacterium]
MTKRQRGSSRQAEDNGAWVAGEVAGCQFHDARLGKRLGSLLHQLGGSIGGTIPVA